MLSPQSISILAVFTPFVAALLSHLIARLPRVGANIAKGICILTAYITFFLVFELISTARSEPFKVHLFSLPLPTGITDMGLYVDCLSLIPAFLSSLFTALALTYNVYYLSPYNKAYKIGWEFNRSYSFILLFNGAMLGTLFSDNLLSLLIFWELVSLCFYMLISFWYEDEFCLWAAIKALVMTHIGSLSLLVAAIIIYSYAGTLKILELGQKIPLEDPVIPIIFPLLLIAALPKTVLFPLHTWLPDGTVAPTSATVVFHVCGFQSGIYIVVRFLFDIFREHIISSPAMPLSPLFGKVSIWGFIISFIGALTLVIGILNGLIENDFKRIIACGTIAGLGYIAMAVGLATPLGIIAGLFLMITHAFCFGLLFLCAGAVIYATGKHGINEVEGLYRQMPITAGCCLIGALSMSTMPLLGEFAGKYLFLNAALVSQSTLLIAIALFGCVLNAAVAIKLFYSVFMRRSSNFTVNLLIRDPPIFMTAQMIFMSMALTVFGVAPSIILNTLVVPAVEQITHSSMNAVLQFGLIETPLGFWNPIVVAASIAVLSALLVLLTLYSRKASVTYRATRSEETVKPFLCGEDSSMLDNPAAPHLYRVTLEILEIDRICYVSNPDRVYNILSKYFNDLVSWMRRLDIQQNYIAAVLSFIIGALIITVVSILVG